MASWWTFAFQSINFLALVWLLHRFLYRPVQRTIAERGRRAEEAAERVRAAEQAADQAREAVEVERRRATDEGVRMLEEVRAKAVLEREGLLARARGAADEVVAAGRRILDEERVQATAVLEAHASEVAAALAARVLGELATYEIDAALLAKLDTYLANLPAERRSELAEEAVAGLEVRTAHELDVDAKASWHSRLVAHLGASACISFRAEPALIAGAELQFRSLVVRMSWRDALGRAESALRAHAVAH